MDNLIVREATIDDRRIIWEWWNDPVTRQMMKKTDYVEWNEHCIWFENLLKDKNRVLCIGLKDFEKIGVVRFDLRADKEYEVSINLNPNFRGKGYAPVIMRESVNYLKKIRAIKKLFGIVGKKHNHPSKKTFLKAGFSFKKENEDGWYCELLLNNKYQV